MFFFSESSMLIYQNLSSIKQQMNFLIPYHPICCYLIFSNQPELLLTQRLSLIIFVPIISPKIQYQETYQQPFQIIYHNFSLFLIFFQCSKQESQYIWKWLVKVQSWRIHSRLLLSRLASHIKNAEK